MATLAEIQSAQSKLIDVNTGNPINYVFKRILINIPISLITLFNPNNYKLWRFDPNHYDSLDDNNHVYMILFPDYSPEDKFLGEQGLNEGFTTPAITNVSSYRRIYNAKVNSQREDFFYYILERLIKISNTSNFGTYYVPIKIIDFCFPEASDDTISSNITSNGEIGTIRWGKIEIGKRPDGLVLNPTTGQNYFLSDWDFKFYELDIRQ